MIITLTGENSFAIAQAERQIIDAFVAKHGGVGVERVAGEELQASRLPDLLQGATLFAPSRLVIIKDINSNKAIQDPLLQALQQATSETTVVIADTGLDKRTKLYKFLKTKTTFKEFAYLNEAQLADWAAQTAKEASSQLAAQAAPYLVRQVGHDQWRLYNEIQKLAAKSDQITQRDINLLVEPTPEGTAFELLDAVLAGQAKQAAAILANLKTEEDPYKLFGLLAAQVHALAVVAAAQGRPAEQIARDSGLHPFVIRKTQAVAKRLGMDKIKVIAQEVADCDWRLKSTGADPWQLLSATLQKISQQ